MLKDKEYYLNKIFVGLVEDDNDEKRLGRVRVRVQGVFNNIELEHIPWASPYRSLDGKEFSKPTIGKIVNIIFPEGNIYEPQYIYSERYNINLQSKLNSLDEEEYKKFVALLFDHRTQIYSDDTALNLDYFNNVIRIKDNDIDIKLKDNSQLLNLGHSDCDQDAVLGTNFFDWFDEFMQVLITPSSLIGNFGAPILKAQLDQKISEYFSLRPSFVSNNVKIIDNGKIDNDDYDDDRLNESVSDDNVLMNDTSVLNPDPQPALDYSSNEYKNKEQLKNNIEEQRRKDTEESVENEPNNNLTEPRDADDYDEDIIKNEKKEKDKKVEEKLKTYKKKDKNKNKKIKKGIKRNKTGYGLYESPNGNNGNIETSSIQSKKVEGNTNTDDIIITGDLKNIGNSKYLKYQSTRNGKKPIEDFNSNGKTITKKEIVKNMNNFIEDVLSPFSTFLKNKYNKLYSNLWITSSTRAYVPKSGSLTSQHFYGQAIDIGYGGSFRKKNDLALQLLNAILEWYQLNPVGYDQILFETRDKKSCWIHWSYKRNNNRIELRRFVNDITSWNTPLTKLGLKHKYILPNVDSNAADLYS